MGMFAFRDNHPKGLSLVVIVVLCVALALAGAPRVSLAEDPDAMPGEEVAESNSSESDGSDVEDDSEQEADESESTDVERLQEEQEIVLTPMASSYQELVYNDSIIAQIGNQRTNRTNGCNPNSQCKQTGTCACCGLYSAAYANSMFDGVAHNRNEYSNGSTAALYWGKAGLTKHTYPSVASVLRACYDEINSGRPVVLGCTMPNGSWHYVCVIGYDGVSNPDNMAASNIIALDPYYGSRVSLSGYSISRGSSIEAGLFSPSKGSVPFVGPVNHDPISCFDGAEGGEGTVHITGWAYDIDDLSAALTLDVYIGGNADSGEKHVITADVPRPDLNRAHGITGNHGFDVTIDTNMRGYQPVVIYAINVPGSNSNPPLEVKYVTIANKESVPPVISDVQVSDVNPAGYTITCRVMDNVGVDRVQFPTWTSKDGQDDLAGEWWFNTAVSGTKSDGDTWTFRVNASDHNGELGEYATDIYAYDAAGNECKYATVVANLEASTDLPEGRYYIANNKYRDRVLDVEGSSTEDGANVLVYENVETANQHFDVTLNDDSSYTIVAEHSGKAIEVPGASRDNGASIKQCARNGSDAQRWYSWRTDDGSWMFRNKATGYMLDIFQDNDGPNYDVRQYMYHGGNSQRWNIEEVVNRIDIWSVECCNILAHRETGSAIEPKVRLRYNDRILVEGEDYTLSYKNNVSVGIATVIITGIGEFKGTKYKTFDIIEGYDIAEHFDWLPVPRSTSCFYDGTAKEIELYCARQPAPEDNYYTSESPNILGVDFTVSYENNVNAGTARCVLTGISKRLHGTKVIEFTIIPADMSAATISKVADQTYTGVAIEPKPTVKMGNKTLKLGTDYELSYSDNIEAGTATIVINGKGNYGSTRSVSFSIIRAGFSQATVSPIDDQVYTGLELEPKVSVKMGDKTLTADTDYYVVYAKNVNVGTATASIFGRGGYSGVVDATFKILPADISSASIDCCDKVEYESQAIKPQCKVQLGDKTLQANSDYTEEYLNNREVGTATIIVTGKGNYTGSCRKNFEIVRADIKNTVCEPYGNTLPDKTYTGNPIEPNPWIRFLHSWTLVEGTDYTISYENNTNVGTAKAIYTGQGNCVGTKELIFRIIPASISSAEVSAIPDQDYTGSSVKPKPTVKVGDKTLRLGTDYVLSYRNNTNVGTATITISGGGNYEGTKEVTFRIVEGAAGLVFSDVSEATPHWEDIYWLAEAGVSEGWEEADGTRTFRGTLPVLRQDMAAFLYRMAGSPAYVPTPADVLRFSDVNSSTPHATEIWWLASAKVSEGWGEPDGTRTFRGTATVKRQDMAAFLRRLCSLMGGDASMPAGATNPFSDVNSATPHAEDVLWLAGVGISEGWPEAGGARTFRGMEDVLRQDMAAFLRRLDAHVRG